jgi:hypothetical protein
MNTDHTQSSVDVEVVDTQAPSLDVLVRWGASVLHVAHLAPPRTFHVGVAPHECDCVLPASLLGASRVPLVVVDRRGSVWLVVLPGATGTIAVPGQPEAALAPGGDDAAPGAYRVRLPPGSSATLTLGGVVVQVVNGRESRLAVGGYPHDARSWLVGAASIVLHAGLLVAAAAAMPALRDTQAGEDGEVQDHRFLIAHSPNAEREEAEPPAVEEAERDPDDRQRVDSRCGEIRGGSMGKRTASATNRRFGVEGRVDNPDPHVARDPYARAPWPESWLGLPHASGGDGNGPVAVWGRDDSWGNDPLGARGHMWGADVGDAFGSSGVGSGLTRLCETCGGRGMGARPRLHTLAAGDTGTEKTGLLVAAR